jgi:hypothetical protein
MKSIYSESAEIYLCANTNAGSRQLYITRRKMQQAASLADDDN